ncbi:unnamed protein product [Protopolystoma xenopodis]|uniref:Uncharacterized protein n=1 Tax=Protopolystoma xenopodis TaxID=117903 RepID=A0A3S5B5U8_9PLAT|nr:unnamed protein product [Protopolystoma xenopodis]
MSVVDLLPDSSHDLVGQLIGPALGSLPILVAPELTWQFDSASRTVWEVDAHRLVAAHALAASNAKEQGRENELGQSNSVSRLFETDFSLSFWLRRLPTAAGQSSPEKEPIETIFCSQDENSKSAANPLYHWQSNIWYKSTAVFFSTDN